VNQEPPVLELRDITKRFGGTVALKGVGFDLRRGEIHGLVGENGAGKSTLIKIFAGVHGDYEGSMLVNGRPVRFKSAADAKAAGLGVIYQELSVIRQLTVAENIFLGVQPVTAAGVVKWSRMYREAGRHLSDLGIHVNVRRPLGSFPLGVQQMVEIARVVYSGARIILMDEPTSALSPRECERLFEFTTRLRDQGVGIIFISHFLDDVLALSDRVTVLKNGVKVATLPRMDANKSQLIHLMIGADADVLEEGYEQGTILPPATDREIVLETVGLRAGRLFQDISLQVRRGEILGIYGYMGAGHFELGRSLFGVTPSEGGVVRVRGKQVRIKTPAQAKGLGIAYLPENRKSTLLLKASLTRNITITFLERIRRVLLHEQTERRIGAEMVNRVGAHPANAQLPALSLSGGNQQKVALAKWIRYLPAVLILTEPTRGMDVGAKKDVLDIVQELKREGVAVILISSEPETVMSISDRILVISKGRIMKEFVNTAISKDVMLSFG